jgi:acetyltransferase-like isoleucine patch superfamily enzyme
MDFSVQCDGVVQVSGTKNISLGQRCRLGMDIELRTIGTGSICIGNDVRINRGGTLTAYESISIGEFTLIGEFVSLRDANHGLSRKAPIRYQPHTAKAITIGRDVWIGRGCCILPGVTIGEGAVVGANSVVNRDIAPFSIAAGVPAKVIKLRE